MHLFDVSSVCFSCGFLAFPPILHTPQQLFKTVEDRSKMALCRACIAVKLGPPHPPQSSKNVGTATDECKTTAIYICVYMKTSHNLLSLHNPSPTWPSGTTRKFTSYVRAAYVWVHYERVSMQNHTIVQFPCGGWFYVPEWNDMGVEKFKANFHQKVCGAYARLLSAYLSDYYKCKSGIKTFRRETSGSRRHM